MRFGVRRPEATDKHSEYVIFIDFLIQQLLQASLLRLYYIVGSFSDIDRRENEKENRPVVIS
jgi:hypothetical protein